MEIEIFSLCDHAQDFGGKMIIVGTFDAIWAGGFPCMHPSCAIAGRIRFDSSEAGKHSLRIQIVDVDGREIVPPLQGELNIMRPPDGRSMAANFVLTLGQLTFPAAGVYSIDLFVNDIPSRSLPIMVQQQPNQPPLVQ